MKFLLTSAGISNPSIDDALVGLLGKPIAESSALIIPTATYPFPDGAFGALPVHQRYRLRPFVRSGLEVVGGAGTHRAAQHPRGGLGSPWSGRPTPCWCGAAMSSTCVTGCGSQDWRPLAVAERVGLRRVSAGSIVMTPYNCDAQFNLQHVPAGSDQAQEGDRALGLVDFARARTSGSRGASRLLHGQRGRVGLRNTSPDVRN